MSRIFWTLRRTAGWLRMVFGFDLDAPRSSSSLSISLVALELDGLDVRPLAHQEAQDDAVVAPVEVDLDVVEEARVPELAHVVGQRFGRKGLADALAQVAQDVVLGDAPVAGDLDAEDRLAAGLLGFAGREARTARTARPTRFARRRCCARRCGCAGGRCARGCCAGGRCVRRCCARSCAGRCCWAGRYFSGRWWRCRGRRRSRRYWLGCSGLRRRLGGSGLRCSGLRRRLGWRGLRRWSGGLRLRQRTPGCEREKREGDDQKPSQEAAAGRGGVLHRGGGREGPRVSPAPALVTSFPS